MKHCTLLVSFGLAACAGGPHVGRQEPPARLRVQPLQVVERPAEPAAGTPEPAPPRFGPAQVVWNPVVAMPAPAPEPEPVVALAPAEPAELAGATTQPVREVVVVDHRPRAHWAAHVVVPPPWFLPSPWWWLRHGRPFHWHR